MSINHPPQTAILVHTNIIGCHAGGPSYRTCCPTVFPVFTTRCTTRRSRPRRPRGGLPSSRPPSPPPPPPPPVLDREDINRPTLGHLPNLDILLPMFGFSPSSLLFVPAQRRGAHGDIDKVRASLALVVARGRARAAAVKVGASGWLGIPLPVRKGEDAALGGAGRLKACAPVGGGEREWGWRGG